MSDKIIVDGYKLIGADSVQSYSSKELTRFELKPPTPSEISNLKEGDEVLVICKVIGFFGGEPLLDFKSDKKWKFNHLVAILPQPQQSTCECCGKPLDKILEDREERKSQQEFCKCGFHSEVEKEYNKCMQCGKPIHPEAAELASIEDLRICLMPYKIFKPVYVEIDKTIVHRELTEPERTQLLEFILRRMKSL